MYALELEFFQEKSADTSAEWKLPYRWGVALQSAVNLAACSPGINMTHLTQPRCQHDVFIATIHFVVPRK